MPDPTSRPRVELRCHGHENISATHRSTLELTRSRTLTRRGTCIVGVAGEWDDRALRSLRGRVRVRLAAGDHEDAFETDVSRSATSLSSLVFRKGPDLRDRTFGFRSTAGAADVDRDLVALLTSSGTVLHITIEQVAAREASAGALYLVGLPDDVTELTPRARRAIEQADVVLAQDQARFRSLADEGQVAYAALAHHRPDGSAGAAADVMARLRGGGRVAVVHDAAGPTATVAAGELVRRAAAEGIPVVPVPGPNAAVAAVMAAGFPGDVFLLVGSLPRRRDRRRAQLVRLATQPAAMAAAVVVTELPQRLRPLLTDLADLLPGRELFIGRELTRLREEHLRTTTDEAVHLLGLLGGAEPRGEHTLVIGPAPERSPDRSPEGRPELDPTTARLVEQLRPTVPTRTLARALSRATGLPRRVAYDLARGAAPDQVPDDVP